MNMTAKTKQHQTKHDHSSENEQGVQKHSTTNEHSSLNKKRQKTKPLA